MPLSNLFYSSYLCMYVYLLFKTLRICLQYPHGQFTKVYIIIRIAKYYKKSLSPLTYSGIWATPNKWEIETLGNPKILDYSKQSRIAYLYSRKISSRVSLGTPG